MQIGVIGARELPEKHQGLVEEVVQYLLGRGHIVAHGGALGADHYVLKTLLAHCGVNRSVLYSAWQSPASFPKALQPDLTQFMALGGKVLWGAGNSGMPYPAVAAALLGRNVRLVNNCHGLVAFLHGKSKGTLSAVAMAQRRKIPIILFPLSEHSDLPQQKGMRWYPNPPFGLWQGSLKAMYSSFYQPSSSGYSMASQILAPAPPPAGAPKHEAMIYA